MTILITGANGKVGTALTAQLKSRKLAYIALDHAQLDITNSAAIKQRLHEYRPSIIINTAAFTQVDLAEQQQEEAYRANALGAELLAQAAANQQIPIIHLSTDYVFSGDKPLAESYVEDDATEPASVYGKSKLAGEQAVRSTNAHHIIIRTAWLFDEHSDNFAKKLITAAKQQLDLPNPTLRIAANQYGCPTDTSDLASAIVHLLQTYASKATLPWGTYHYAGEPAISRLEWAQEILTTAQTHGLITRLPILAPTTDTHYIGSAPRPANSALNCTKIQQLFGIEPSQWRNGLRHLVQSFSTDNEISCSDKSS